MNSSRFTVFSALLLLSINGAFSDNEVSLVSLMNGADNLGIYPINESKVPFIVSIKSLPFKLHQCAGFLISPCHLLTTATCLFISKRGQVRAYLNQNKLEDVNESRDIVDWIIHPDYSHNPQENDIAVAVLGTPVDVTCQISLLPKGIQPQLFRGSTVISLGWGFNKVNKQKYQNFTMQAKKMRIVPKSMCYLLFKDNMNCNDICASSGFREIVSSDRDVGTPLLQSNGDKLYAVGMLTDSTNNFLRAAKYLSLTHYLDFIQSIIENYRPGNKEIERLDPVTDTSVQVTPMNLPNVPQSPMPRDAPGQPSYPSANDFTQAKPQGVESDTRRENHYKILMPKLEEYYS